MKSCPAAIELAPGPRINKLLVASLALVVLCLTACAPLMITYKEHRIDVTEKSAWWGALNKGTLLTPRMDMLMNERKIAPQILIRVKPNSDDNGTYISPADVRMHEGAWPQIVLVPAGTRLRCVALERLISVAYDTYVLHVEFVDGSSKGLVREISMGLVVGDPSKKGNFDVNREFFEVVK
jgi:hypothetical protein